MKRSNSAGKWIEICPECGCPMVKTRLVTGKVVTVWGYEAVDLLLEQNRILQAILDDKLPRSEQDEARSRYDPARGRVEDWSDETRLE